MSADPSSGLAEHPFVLVAVDLVEAFVPVLGLVVGALLAVVGLLESGGSHEGDLAVAVAAGTVEALADIADLEVDMGTVEMVDCHQQGHSGCTERRKGCMVPR